MTFNPNLIDQLNASNIVSDALLLALNCDLFERLQQPQTAENLARELGWRPEQAAHLLELLWSQQLLERRLAVYQTAAAARASLCRGGARFVGDAWRYRLQASRAFGQQLPALMTQRPDESEQLPHDAAWASAAAAQIAQEQRALTAQTACALAAALPHFTRPARLLDMGGGPGLVSVALGQRFPQLHGVVLDLPLTAAVAQTNIERAGLSARFRACSTLHADERVDIIWCSSFLHFVARPAQTLAELYHRLNPGGVLISAHAAPGDDPTRAARVLPYFLPLMMRGRHVFHGSELAQLLSHTGFHVEDRGEHPFPLAPLQVLFAHRGADSIRFCDR